MVTHAHVLQFRKNESDKTLQIPYLKLTEIPTHTPPGASNIANKLCSTLHRKTLHIRKMFHSTGAQIGHPAQVESTQESLPVADN